MEKKKSKRAFFVIGPESSGTRMMTQAFIACGAYGSPGHSQKLDKEGFDGGHNLIVIRRSVPHGHNMPRITKLINDMQGYGYSVVPIIILRDKDKCAASQVKRGHAKTLQEAKDSIKKAVYHIYEHMANFKGYYHVMYYEPFVTSKKVREKFFGRFGFSHPDMLAHGFEDFHNANLKHK